MHGFKRAILAELEIVMNEMRKLMMSADFFVWTLGNRRPPEAAISTLATLIRYQILAKYVSFYMKHCLLVWSKNWEPLDYVSQKIDSPPYLT